MKRGILAAAAALLTTMVVGETAFAQKPGGVLHVHANDSPPSLSTHEESDAVPARAMMAVLNNLVMFEQHTKQNSMQSIVPDLASGWSQTIPSQSPKRESRARKPPALALGPP